MRTITTKPPRIAPPSGAAGQLAQLAGDLSVERLARGAGDNLAGVVLERLFGLALLIALPLLLAPAALGQYYEALAVLSLATIVSMVGLDVGLVRFTALSVERGRFEDIRGYLRVALIWASVTSAIAAMALWAAAPALSGELGDPVLATALRIGACGVPFLTLAYLLVAPSKGLKRMRPQVLVIQVTQPAVQLVAALALVAGGFALAGAVGAFAVSAITAFTVAAVLAARMRLPGRIGTPTTRGRDLVRFSLPVSGMAVLEMALLWIDTLLLGLFRPSAEVAVYGLVVRLMTISVAVLFTVIQIFGPFVTQLLERGDRPRLQSVLWTATRWTVLLAAPILVLLAIEGGEILRLLHLPSEAGGQAISILAAAFLVDAVTGPVGHVLTMSGRSGVNFANAAVALAANVALNLVLIPKLGLIGAALSWALVIVVVNVARTIQVRVLLGIGPLTSSLWRPLAATAAAAGSALAARVVLEAAAPSISTVGSLCIRMAVFAAAYVTAAVLTAHPEDRVLFRALLGRKRADGVMA